LGTNAENTADRVRKGRSRAGAGERNRGARLRESDVIAIRDLYASGARDMVELAATFGVGYTQIWRIVNRRKWVNVPDTGGMGGEISLGR